MVSDNRAHGLRRLGVIAASVCCLVGCFRSEPDIPRPVDVDQPPTADATVVPITGTIATVFRFDASGCSDDRTPVADLEVRWEWGDGASTQWSTSKTATHQYASGGPKTIKLHVRDSAGQTATHVQSVTVATDQQPGIFSPTAVIAVGPASGDVSTAFHFDASGSYDAIDPTTALMVRWDWEYDGSYDTGWTVTKTAVHRFLTPGTWVVRLEVRNTMQLTGTATISITVSALNTTPTAHFAVTPSSGVLSTVFTFDAGESSDDEDPSSALMTRWDWDSDGVYDTAWSLEHIVTHQFVATGDHRVTLEVRDRGGLTDTETRTVGLVNTRPVARLTVSTEESNTDIPIEFDGSGCTDAEDPAGSLEVRWDWEDDGLYDTAWSTDKTASHLYPVAGTFVARLQVRDSQGDTDSTAMSLAIF